MVVMTTKTKKPTMKFKQRTKVEVTNMPSLNYILNASPPTTATANAGNTTSATAETHTASATAEHGHSAASDLYEIPLDSVRKSRFARVGCRTSAAFTLTQVR